MAQTLTHAFISKPLPPDRYYDSTTGLQLYVKKSGAKSWVFRYTRNKVTRDKGLGGYPGVTLSMARDKATILRQELNKGIDPLQKTIKDEAHTKKFQAFSEEYIATNQAQWKNIKHCDQWRNTLSSYAYPVIGSMDVDQIDTSHVLDILKPIWGVKTVTASRVRGRIEKVLSAATTLGLRTGINPALWRGHLENILPSPKKVKAVKHHEALPYKDLPQFIVELHEKDCVSALALEFLILTAARTGEVRFAEWSEIEGNVWTIPGSRMKAGKEHKVPLTDRCIDLLNIAQTIFGKSTYLFHIKGKSLSNVAMSKLLEGMRPKITVHGFRSTFRDWVAEETEVSGEVAEMALAHQIENRVEAVYRRGNLFQRRALLMQEWQIYTESNISTTHSQLQAYDEK